MTLFLQIQEQLRKEAIKSEMGIRSILSSFELTDYEKRQLFAEIHELLMRMDSEVQRLMK